MTLQMTSVLWCPEHGAQHDWTTIRAFSADGRTITDEERFCSACLLHHFRRLFTGLYATQEEAERFNGSEGFEFSVSMKRQLQGRPYD